MLAQQKKLFFPHLDALRFIAFLGVFSEHFFYPGAFELSNDPLFTYVKDAFFYRGYLGVSLFFVISGFLITSLLLQEWKENGKIDVLRFYMRRILRIWPLYFVTLLIGFVLAPALIPSYTNDTAHPLYYIFFAANINTHLFGLPLNQVLIPMWSLAVEEQFYLVFPLLLFFFRGRMLSLVLLLFVIAGLAGRILLFPNFTSMGVHSITVLPDIIIGVFCGLAYQFNWNILQRIEKMGKPLILLIYLIGFYLLFNLRFDFASPWYVISRLIYALFFGFVVLEQSFSKNPIYRLSSLKPLNHLGIISFGLYCLHQPALLCGKWLESQLSNHLSVIPLTLLLYLGCLLLAVIFAEISYRFLEKPFLRIKEKFSAVQNKPSKV